MRFSTFFLASVDATENTEMCSNSHECHCCYYGLLFILQYFFFRFFQKQRKMVNLEMFISCESVFVLLRSVNYYRIKNRYEQKQKST